MLLDKNIKNLKSRKSLATFRWWLVSNMILLSSCYQAGLLQDSPPQDGLPQASGSARWVRIDGSANNFGLKVNLSSAKVASRARVQMGVSGVASPFPYASPSLSAPRINSLRYGVSGNPFDISSVVFNNQVYVSWSEEQENVYGIHVATFTPSQASIQNPTWTLVDGGTQAGLKISNQNIARHPSLAVFNKELYAAWQENSTTIRVAVYNGNDAAPSWTPVDGGGFFSSLNYIYPRLSESNGGLYLSFNQQTAGGTSGSILVYRYSRIDSSSNWTEVHGWGSNGIGHGGGPVTPSFATLGSNLYAVWSENSGAGGIPYISSYDGQAWADQGMNDELRTTVSGISAINVVSHAGKLFTAWSPNTAPGMTPVRLASFDPTQAPGSRWLYADGGGSQGLNQGSNSVGILASLADVSGTLYAGWVEAPVQVSSPTPLSYQVYVSQYSDTAGTWALVGGGGLVTDPRLNRCTSSCEPKILNFNGSPIVIWMETNAAGISVSHAAMYLPVSD